MKLTNRCVSLAAIGLVLVALSSNGLAQSGAAESACMAAVNSNYGGKERELKVVSSDWSQAGTEVIVEADGERWRCLASNDGEVEDLSMMQSSPRGRTAAGNAAESACMAAVDRNYGGDASLSILHSEFSQAGTEVIIEANGERWRCLASNDGEVEDLSMQ